MMAPSRPKVQKKPMENRVITKFLKFSKANSDLTSELSTPKYRPVLNFRYTVKGFGS